VLVGSGVNVKNTTLFAPTDCVLAVGVTRGELVATERAKPIPHQNKIMMPTMDKIEVRFFAGIFGICCAGLIGVATGWGCAAGFTKSRPQ
jgi:hypothetical protein